MTSNAVLGIDLGTECSTVAFVGRGPLDGKGVVDVVQDDQSQRRVETLVMFSDRARSFAHMVRAQMKSNLKNVCRDLKHLLVKGGPAVLSTWQLCGVGEGDDGYPAFQVTHRGTPRQFSAIQVVGMMLGHLKGLGERWAQAPASDVVVSVPAHFSENDRKALISAADVAGMSILRVFDEPTAVALSYGFYRVAEFDSQQPTHVGFVSMGHSTFFAAVVAFTSGGLRVVSVASDPGCGGRDLDLALMAMMALNFRTQHPDLPDPMSNIKARLKMEQEASKLKKTLSANANATYGIDCLLDGEDLGGTIERDAFEAACAPIVLPTISRILEDVTSAAASQGVSLEALHSVEMVGGAMRVPMIQKHVQDHFKRTLSTTLNADEAVARGCALMAAIQGSSLRRVREFVVAEQCPKVTKGALGASMLRRYMREEDQLAGESRNVRLAEEARNALEAFMFSMEQGEKRSSLELWLEDHVDDDCDVFKDKLKQLREECGEARAASPISPVPRGQQKPADREPRTAPSSRQNWSRSMAGQGAPIERGSETRAKSNAAGSYARSHFGRSWAKGPERSSHLRGRSRN
mmetsp:Transcript_72595/g.193617  ORF Transcript_72595/g.193617 Transcript_72595/m.193617 type:complete len:577 (-) Transcript_72595:41-1771(-)